MENECKMYLIKHGSTKFYNCRMIWQGGPGPLAPLWIRACSSLYITSLGLEILTIVDDFQPQSLKVDYAAQAQSDSMNHISEYSFRNRNMAYRTQKKRDVSLFTSWSRLFYEILEAIQILTHVIVTYCRKRQTILDASMLPWQLRNQPIETRALSVITC